jgi:hypothetical protein
MTFQASEISPERDVLVGVEVLIGEEENEMFVQQGAERGDFRVADFGETQTADFCAQRSRETSHVEVGGSGRIECGGHRAIPFIRLRPARRGWPRAYQASGAPDGRVPPPGPVRGRREAR